MEQSELKDKIAKALIEGLDEATIRKNLRAEGHTDAQITDAFQYLQPAARGVPPAARRGFFIISLLLIAGLGWFAVANFINTPEKVLEKMIKRTSESPSFSFATSVTFKTSSQASQEKTKIDTPSALGDGGLHIEASADMEGAINALDEKNPKIQLLIKKVSFSMASFIQLSFTPELEIRGFNDVSYFRMKNPPADFLYDLSPYANQWIEGEIPKKVQEESKSKNPSSEEAKKIAKSARDHKIVTIVKAHPQEKVKDVNSYHYEIALNKENLLAWAEDTKKILGEKPYTKKEKDEFKKDLENLKVSNTHIWIAKGKYTPTKFTTDMRYESEVGAYDMRVETTFDKFGPIDIVRPKGAKKMDDVMKDLDVAPYKGSSPFNFGPGDSFARSNNTKRQSDINAILNAVSQYAVENRGDLTPLGINSQETTIGTRISENSKLCGLIVPEYLATLPFDPSSKDYFTNCNGIYTTGYTIKTGANGRITVAAPSAELGETISVTR